MVIDEIYTALTLFRRRKYDKCVDLCNKLMLSTVHQKMAWELKMRAVTQRVYVDEIEADDGIEGNQIDPLHDHLFNSLPIGSQRRHRGSTTGHSETPRKCPSNSNGTSQDSHEPSKDINWSPINGNGED